MRNRLSRTAYSKDFYLMMLGQVITVFGTTLLRFGLSLYILDTTGREDVYATILALSNLPLLLTPIGGAISDRWNQKKIMVFTDAGYGVVVVGAMLLLDAAHLTPVWVGSIMVLFGFLNALEYPNTIAALPLIVSTEGLNQANGIVIGFQMLATVVAPVLGGMLYALLGVRGLLFISLIVFLSAVLMECFIHIPSIHATLPDTMIGTLLKDLKMGLLYTVRQTFLRNCMILAALLNLLLTPLFVVGTPIILRITLRSSDLAYGWGMAIIPISTLAGALAAGKLSSIIKMKKLYRWVLVVALLTLPMAVSVFPLRLSYSSMYALFFLGAAPISLLLSLISIIIVTQVQQNTPEHLRGKVLAIIITAAQSTAPLGQLIYGVLFRRFSSALYLVLFSAFVALLLLSGITKRLLDQKKTW